MESVKTSTFSVLFFIKKTKLLKNGEAPICMRISVNGQRSEIMVKKSVLPHKWEQSKERVLGNDAKSIEINKYLGAVKAKVIKVHRELEQDEVDITACAVCDRFYGRDKEVEKTIVEIYEEHNEYVKSLIGKGFVEKTYYRYVSSLSRLKQFMKQQYRCDDMPISQVDLTFIRCLDVFLKTQCGCQHNTAMKHLKNLKKVIGIAIAHGWITKDPFFSFRFRYEEVDVGFLTKEDLQKLIDKHFEIPRLENVRDVFVFCCYTGLAFSDVKTLRPEHIMKDNNGKLWIRKDRVKTKVVSNIPVLSAAEKILEKYNDHPCREEGMVLPVISNQRMNSYLDEIRQICGIKKHLTTHLARHTCATVVMLANDVALQNVAKILGHTNTRTTQRYARVLDSSILRDMANVEAAFGS